jgi:large subunit ribosomal protein L24
MEKIRKGDSIVVIAGKDVGKKGEIIRVIPEKSRVVVKGINMVKKAEKKSKERPNGGFLEIEAGINRSNVMVNCPKCNKGVRVGILVNEKGERSRVCKKCNHKFD